MSRRLATPIEPGSRPPGVVPVRLLGPPEDPVLRFVLVGPIFGARTVFSRDRGGIFQTQRGWRFSSDAQKTPFAGVFHDGLARGERARTTQPVATHTAQAFRNCW